MSNLVYVDIGETKYPMCFSVKASRKILKKYGSLDKIMGDQDVDEDNMDGMDEKLEAISFLLETLIASGVGKTRLLGKEAPDALSADDIEELIGFSDFEPLMQKVGECMGGGSEREVQVKDPNEETTQDE